MMSINPRHSSLVAFDASLCLLTIWLSVTLKNEELFVVPRTAWPLLASAVIVCTVTLTVNGIYRWIDLRMGQVHVFQLARAVAVYGIIFFCLSLLFYPTGIPRSVGIFQPIVFFVFLIAFRSAINFMVIKFQCVDEPEKESILIYGAGSAGRQLASVITEKYRVVGFIDDDSRKSGLRIDGIEVVDVGRLKHSAFFNVRKIFLALPSISGERREEIFDLLTSNLGYTVVTIPRLSDLISKRSAINEIRPLELEDLLERSTVKPNDLLMRRNIEDKTVLVTGAGGSIGSELCRQIVLAQPTELILIDHSEFHLFQIHRELVNIVGETVKITPILASVVNHHEMERVFSSKYIHTVFHAAAYKHVHLLELNSSKGLINNVSGTLVTSQLASKFQVESFVLVSTDKAVKPSSIMGLSKRISELITLRVGKDQDHMQCVVVRFGNVLGSNGSVIPIFRQQIENGGPLTVTHPEVTRYFMTIPEAASLVIQAGAMAVDGEIYVLDMGDPISILAMAEKLIRLEGKEVVYHRSNDPGEIEIRFTGLKTGEKLHEELSSSGIKLSTAHPKIFKIKEPEISAKEFHEIVELFRCDYADRESHLVNYCLSLLVRVDGYQIERTEYVQ